MSDDSTTRMLDAYVERRVSPSMFFTSLFGLNPRGIHSSEFVEQDVRRGEPRIAIPVPSITSGARKVENTDYQNVKYKPAVIKLESTISAWSTTKRRPGVNPFEDPDFIRAATSEAFQAVNDCEDMTRRTVELMAAQIFQTGKIALKDSGNVTIYPVDFGARPSHYLTTTQWAANGASGDPIKDIAAMCKTIRRNGKRRPTDIVFGSGARDRFFINTNVKTLADNLGLQKFLDIAPQDAPEDVSYIGQLVVGNYRLRAWEYDADYIDPASEESTPFLADNNVVILVRDAQREQTYGDIPQFLPADAELMQFLPPRMTSLEAGFDLTTNVWVSPDRTNLNLSVGTRPLPIPTALDCHGCLTVY